MSDNGIPLSEKMANCISIVVSLLFSFAVKLMGNKVITTNQKKQIASYLDIYYCTDGDIVIVNGHDPVEFDPLEDAWNRKILDALVDECKKREFHEVVISDSLKIGSWNYREECFEGHVFEGEFNNESICLAYLAVMESK